jgi:hypothetical protein
MVIKPPNPQSFKTYPSHYTDHATPTPEHVMCDLKCLSFLFRKTLAGDGLQYDDMSSEEITGMVYVLAN